MYQRLLRIASMAGLAAASLFAQGQDITGAWQGTLQAGARDLRIVFKIAKSDAGLKTTLYSIDQGGQGFPGGATTLQGGNLKVTVPAIGATYEGKLSADGTTVTGTWTQGPSPLPLVLKHATPETSWAIPEPPPPVKPMRADANLVFEVATIKPSKPDAQGRAITVRGQQFITINTSMADMIGFAYGLHPRQITGGPAWLESDRFDIVAKPEAEGQANDKQLKAMVQKLLAERLQFTFHRDKKELSVYAVVPAKSGPKLTPSSGDPNGLPGLGFRGLGALVARNATLADFANLMQSTVLDKPVVDQSGLTGRFDFTLNWTPDEFQFANLGVKAPPAPDKDAPDLYSAIQQQLGLKIEPTKASTEIMVIDRIERPAAN